MRSLLSAGSLALSLSLVACGSQPKPDVPSRIQLCGQVTEDFQCRHEVRAIAPGLPYDFLVSGPDFEGRDIEVRLLRRGDGSLVHALEDRVEPEANTYANNFQVTQPGAYRLEVHSGGHLHASLAFEAGEERAAPRPRAD